MEPNWRQEKLQRTRVFGLDHMNISTSLDREGKKGTPWKGDSHEQLKRGTKVRGSLMSSLKTVQVAGEETRAVGMGAETEGPVCGEIDGCGSQCKGTQLKASVGTVDEVPWGTVQLFSTYSLV